MLHHIDSKPRMTVSQRVEQLEQENAELRERLAVLETFVRAIGGASATVKPPAK